MDAMNVRISQHETRLLLWRNIFRLTAALGLILCVIFGALPGFVTAISLVFWFLISYEISRTGKSPERIANDRKANRRALMILAIVFLLLLLLPALAMI